MKTKLLSKIIAISNKYSRKDIDLNCYILEISKCLNTHFYVYNINKDRITPIDKSKPINIKFSNIDIFINELKKPFNGKPIIIKNILNNIKELNQKNIITIFPIGDSSNIIGFIATTSNSHDIINILEIISFRIYNNYQIKEAHQNYINTDFDKVKNEFLSKISHEIRTPLNAIIGTSSLLKKNNDLNDNSKLKLQIIETYSSELLSLINNLLNYNVIKKEKIIIQEERFEMEHLLLSLKEMIDYKLLKKNINLQIKLNIINNTIYGDRNKLIQILDGILDNAIKFSNKNSNIVLSVEQNKNQFIFKCIDQGIGLNTEELKSIFSEFNQVDNSLTREYCGSGLGLFLIKETISTMNGNINISSKKHRGTSVIIQIPFKIKKQKSKRTQFNGKLLIVEDNEINRSIAKEHFSNLGFVCDTAENGKVAVDLIKNNNLYNLIIMDLQMPVLDGFEATKQIKKINSNIPIVAFTAHSFEEDQLKCYKLGMVDFLTKPINIENFINSFTSIIPETLNNLDSDYLLNYTNPSYSMNKDPMIFVKKIISKFLDKTNDDLDNLFSIVDKQDINSFQKECHRLKSSFASFGLNKTSNILKELQKTKHISDKMVYKLKKCFIADKIALLKWIDSKENSYEK